MHAGKSSKGPKAVCPWNKVAGVGLYNPSAQELGTDTQKPQQGPLAQHQPDLLQFPPFFPTSFPS